MTFYAAVLGPMSEPNEIREGTYYHMQVRNLGVAAMYQQGDEQKQQGAPPY